MATSVDSGGWCARLCSLFLQQNRLTPLSKNMESRSTDVHPISSNRLNAPRDRVDAQVQQITKNNLLELLLAPANTTFSGRIQSFLENRDICNLVGVSRAFLEAEETKVFQVASKKNPFYLEVIRRYRKISQLSEQEWARLQLYFPKATHFKGDGQIYRGAQVTDDEVIALVEHFPQLREIHLFACSQITGNAVLVIARYCSKLEKITLGRTSIKDAEVVELVERCPDLKEMDLRASPITDIALEAIGKHCQHLSWLELVRCQSITSAGVKSLVKNCQMLRHLDLRGCSPAVDHMAHILKGQYPTLRVNWEPSIDLRSPLEEGAFMIF